MLHSAPSLHEPTIPFSPIYGGPHSYGGAAHSSPTNSIDTHITSNGHTAGGGQAAATTNGYHHPNGSTLAAVALTAAAAAMSAGLPANVKDSRWLTLEVCRQYQRNQCSRDENECKFAHPPTHVDVQNGRVVCCYDSIKGKCQRRDPPCKYLHPPQHLREQLVQNGRNNMIFRNMQMQMFQQQLIAHTGGILPFNPASGVACSTQGSNSSAMAGATTQNSLLYQSPNGLAIGAPTCSNAYPFLNLGFSHYMGALPGSAVTSNGTALPSHLTSTELMTTECNQTPPKRPALTDGKSGLPFFFSKPNGTTAQTNGTLSGKLDRTDASATNCLMVVNGGPIDSLKEMNATYPHSTTTLPQLRPTAGVSGNLAAATAATLYALHNSQNGALLNLPPGSHHHHHPHHQTTPHQLTSLSPTSLAAVVNGSMNAAHYSTVPDPMGYFQPAYHIEISPYSYN